MSFPRSIGTAPAFYDYLKGARPIDPGRVLDDGTIMFGHQVRVFVIVLRAYGRFDLFTYLSTTNIRLSTLLIVQSHSGASAVV